MGQVMEVNADFVGTTRYQLDQQTAGGLSVTKTVRAAGGATDCTLIFTNGLLTGGTC